MIKRARGTGAILWLLTWALLAGPGALQAQAEMPFFDFSGFSYLDGEPWQVGTGVAVVARFNSIQPNPIWPLDFVANEYTVLLEGLTLSSVLSYDGVKEVAYSGGTISVLRDPARNSEFAPEPPNGLVPGSFGDGSAELVGYFTELALFYDETTGVGTVAGFVNWTGGAKQALLENPNGWTFFGGVSNQSVYGIPDGYDLAWDPQIYGQETPVPVMLQSWGALKARFAR
jgi:hypothetical protein